MIAVSTTPFWLVLAPADKTAPLDPDLREAVQRVVGCVPRVGGPAVTVHGAALILGPIGTPPLAALLELVARDAGCALCIWVGEPNNARFEAKRAVAHARRSPTRVVVEVPPGPREVQAALRPSVAVLRGLVDLHLTVLLARTPTQWRILDALRAADGRRRIAAQALGCSRQAVDQAVRRGAYDASARTASALAATLTLTTSALAA